MLISTSASTYLFQHEDASHSFLLLADEIDSENKIIDDPNDFLNRDVKYHPFSFAGLSPIQPHQSFFNKLIASQPVVSQTIGRPFYLLFHAFLFYE